MTKPNILIVEDDPDIQQLVTYNLIKVGMNATCSENGEEALIKLENEHVDAIILDLMLPGKDGLEICQTIREKESTNTIPIIILTAKSEEEDIVKGLEIGADDYVTKPFSPKVLIARLNAVLRRKNELTQLQDKKSKIHSKSIHGLTIHPGRHKVYVDGQQVDLTSTEFAILELLVNKAGWVFTRQQIIDNIRGHDYLITSRTIDVQIFGLRKKLGKCGNLIETVRGIGYRMRE